MTLLRWDDKGQRPKFDTFDESALKQGGLGEAVERVVAGESVPAAVVHAMEGKMETKSIFSSRTFWFNLLTGAADLIGHAAGIIPPQYQPYIAAASALINIGLRWVTTQPVSINPSP